MRRYSRVVAVLAGLLAHGVTGAVAQEVHEVRMVADGKGEFRFEPASVSAGQGDVLLFKVVSGAPHSVVFDGKKLSEPARQALNGALPRRAGDLSSPPLKAGAEYRVVVPAAVPAGRYPFFCLPHRAYDMRGELIVE